MVIVQHYADSANHYAEADPFPGRLFPLPARCPHPECQAVDVSDLQVDCFAEAETARLDGAQEDAVARAMYDAQNEARFSHAEHHRELLRMSRTHQFEGGPLFSEHMLEEKPDAA